MHSMSSQAGFLVHQIPDRVFILSSSLFTVVSGILGISKVLLQIPLWQNTWRQIFLSGVDFPRAHSFVFQNLAIRTGVRIFFPSQLPDSYSHRLADWLESHMKLSPSLFVFLKNIHSHKTCPWILPHNLYSGSFLFLHPFSSFPLQVPAITYCHVNLPWDLIQFFCSFLFQSLKHYAIIHQLAKSHNKITI